jgi:lipopolysaccharide export LptBFGC system permease protein LptF
MKTYSRHLLRQWLYNFLLAFTILDLLLLVANTVKYANKVGILNIIPMLPMILPSMLYLSLPMAGLIATITTISRTRQRHETVSLASSGISGTQLLPLFMGLGFCLSAICLACIQWLSPLGESYKSNYLANIGAKLLQSELNKPQASLQLKNNTLTFFRRENNARSAIIQKRDGGVITQEIFFENTDISIDPNYKLFELNSTGKVHIMTYNENESGHLSTKSFPTIRLPYVEKYTNSGPQNTKQWSLTHAWHRIKHKAHHDLNKLQSRFYEKLCLGLSPIFLVCAGFFLGFIDKGSRLTGHLTGLGLLFLVFYPLLMMGKKMVNNGSDTPLLLTQMPNIVLALLCLLALPRVNRWT